MLKSLNKVSCPRAITRILGIKAALFVGLVRISGYFKCRGDVMKGKSVLLNIP
jgi:hypothetical protein